MFKILLNEDQIYSYNSSVSNKACNQYQHPIFEVAPVFTSGGYFTCCASKTAAMCHILLFRQQMLVRDLQNTEILISRLIELNN